jgi:hypothetical protein
MRLAQLVGVTQADIARALGLSREQPHRWAKGMYPVPPHHLQAVIRQVLAEAFAWLDRGKLDAPLEGEALTQTEAEAAAGMRPISAARREVEALVSRVTLRYHELDAVGPTVLVPRLIEDLWPYRTMRPEALREPDTARRLVAQLETALAAAKLLARLGPVDPHEGEQT